MAKFTVLKDSREKLGWDFPESTECLGTTVCKLDTGDYTILEAKDLLCIERKQNVSELAHNFIEARFTKELERLQEFKYKFLICEFRLQDMLTYPIGSEIPKARHHMVRIKYPFMFSRVNSLQTKYGINVIFADNPKVAAAYAYSIFKYVEASLNEKQL